MSSPHTPEMAFLEIWLWLGAVLLAYTVGRLRGWRAGLESETAREWARHLRELEARNVARRSDR